MGYLPELDNKKFLFYKQCFFRLEIILVFSNRFIVLILNFNLVEITEPWRQFNLEIISTDKIRIDTTQSGIELGKHELYAELYMK